MIKKKVNIGERYYEQEAVDVFRRWLESHEGTIFWEMIDDEIELHKDKALAEDDGSEEEKRRFRSRYNALKEIKEFREHWLPSHK